MHLVIAAASCLCVRVRAFASCCKFFLYFCSYIYLQTTASPVLRRTPPTRQPSTISSIFLSANSGRTSTSFQRFNALFLLLLSIALLLPLTRCNEIFSVRTSCSRGNFIFVTIIKMRLCVCLYTNAYAHTYICMYVKLQLSFTDGFPAVPFYFSFLYICIFS